MDVLDVFILFEETRESIHQIVTLEKQIKH